jgi:hypothetical protein
VVSLCSMRAIGGDRSVSSVMSLLVYCVGLSFLAAGSDRARQALMGTFRSVSTYN